MQSRVRRPFTIADGMILVAAAGVASLLGREYVMTTFLVWRRATADRLLIAIGGPMTCAAASLMVALIPIRLRHPRPRLARVFRQPGFAASIAISGVLFLGFVQGVILIGARDPRIMGFPHAWPFQQLWEITVGFQGQFAVAAVWLLLVVTGRWRSEPSWVDRLGRACGAVWVGGLLVHWLEPWLLPVLPAY